MSTSATAAETTSETSTAQAGYDAGDHQLVADQQPPFLRVKVSDVIKHPKNPRHRAFADAEMVASVTAQGLLQPLLLAPHPEKTGKWIVVAGHRRLDALKKAKLKTAPAYLRWDLETEAQQVEAMIIENGDREGLTPIEEAEGYAQLQLFGYSQKAIADRMGRDAKTVRARLKLLKLQPATQKKVHAGQLRLEDAAAVGEFSDDTEATRRLEKAAGGDGYNFKQALQRERRRRTAERNVATAEAELLEHGATQHELGQYESVWQMKTAKRLQQTHSTDWDQHDGCLGYVKTKGSEWSDPSIEPVCTNPGRHDEDLAAEQRERQAAERKAREEREAVTAAEEAAGDVRVQSVLEIVGTDTQMPGQLVDVVRLLLPLLVADLFDGLGRYQEAMGLPADQRWTYQNGYIDRGEHNVGHLARLRQHLDELASATGGTLTRALVALLAATADANLVGSHDRRLREAGRYTDLLGLIGHEFGDVDEQLLTAVARQLKPRKADEPLVDALEGHL